MKQGGFQPRPRLSGVNYNVGGIALATPHLPRRAIPIEKGLPGFRSLFSIGAAGFMLLRKSYGLTLGSHSFTKSDILLGIEAVTATERLPEEDTDTERHRLLRR